ncbi:hypothetical protein A1D29_03425 [Pasteurellaceae bacterium Orientalotternb1]|nr:hypothetical protein A1D29_03425 [Pasteurellaceae bacterium Orientalotternb1]
MGNNDLALNTLAILANFHNVPVNEAQIKHQFDIHGTVLTKTNWLLAPKSLGLKTKVVKKFVERLPFVHLPAMVWLADGNHFFTAVKCADSN